MYLLIIKLISTMNYTLNIVGHGFVGGSVGYLFEQKGLHYNVYDTRHLVSNDFTHHNSIGNLVQNSEETPEKRKLIMN